MELVYYTVTAVFLKMNLHDKELIMKTERFSSPSPKLTDDLSIISEVDEVHYHKINIFSGFRYAGMFYLNIDHIMLLFGLILISSRTYQIDRITGRNAYTNYSLGTTIVMHNH